MTSASILNAMQESEKLVRLRRLIATKDIAVTYYGKYPDDDPTPDDERIIMMSLSRPQDFATGDDWQYHRYSKVVPRVLDDGTVEAQVYFVHLYWDDGRDLRDAIDLLNKNFIAVSGEWQPTAPSDPVSVEDFWDTEQLGQPVNGWWRMDEYGLCEYAKGFEPFSNWGKAYEFTQVMHGDTWTAMHEARQVQSS
ncbi:MAG: hypothetical protein ACPG7F_00600 [Aggregatilineales bacterium]